MVPADSSVTTDCERPPRPPRFPHVLTHPRQPKETATRISPNQGSTSGGTLVTITGTNLSNTSAVRFGTKLATITANTPTSAGAPAPFSVINDTTVSAVARRELLAP
nr:IPT/TIG domain-containing protein [Streptomyces sp. IB2014 016-6]